MLNLGNGINDLHRAFAHATYEGFPEIHYEDRDWEHYRKTKEDKRIKKKRKHSEHDVYVFSMFPQTWGSTALGFGGLGGQAITSAYVVVLKSTVDRGFCVYFGGRFAYYVEHPNSTFFDDITKSKMCDVKEFYNRYHLPDE